MHATNTSISSDDIDIAALFRALNERKFMIFGCAVAAAFLTYFALLFVTPQFTSESQIIIERENNSYKRPADSSENSPVQETTDKANIKSQVQVMRSRDLAQGVVADLKLAGDPEFHEGSPFGKVVSALKSRIRPAAPKTQAQNNERVLNAFRKRLTVYQVEGSRVITIQFQSRDPATAERVANRVAELYLTWQQGEKIKQTREASEWLKSQIVSLKKKVESAEIEAERFRLDIGHIEGRNKTTLDVQELSELNSQIILAKATRTEAEARADLIKRMLEEKGDVASAADVLKSNLIQRMLEQRLRVQRAIAESSVTLLPSHPRVRALNSELADVKRQIRQEARKIVSGLENEAQIAGAREASLRDSLDEMKNKKAENDKNNVKLLGLERELKANRKLLESYMDRYRDASARSDQGAIPTRASIVSRAHISTKPSFPRKGPLSMLAFAAVAFLGFTYTIGRELIAPQHAARPHLTPAQPIPQGRLTAHPAQVASLSSQAEFSDWLMQPWNRSVVLFSMMDPNDTISLAVNTARMAALSGRTALLVDAMDSGELISHELGLGPGAGFFDITSGGAEFDDAVRRDPQSSLQIISGSIGSSAYTGNPQTLSNAMSALCSVYDHVIYMADPSSGAGLIEYGPEQGLSVAVLATPDVDVGNVLAHFDNLINRPGLSPAPIAVVQGAAKRTFFNPMDLIKRAG